MAKAKLAESWVGTGPNKQVTPAQLEQAIGPEVLATLSKQTGLSRDELLARLSRELPAAVDKYTPHGLLPDGSGVFAYLKRGCNGDQGKLHIGGMGQTPR